MGLLRETRTPHPECRPSQKARAALGETHSKDKCGPLHRVSAASECGTVSFCGLGKLIG